MVDSSDRCKTHSGKPSKPNLKENTIPKVTWGAICPLKINVWGNNLSFSLFCSAKHYWLISSHSLVHSLLSVWLSLAHSHWETLWWRHRVKQKTHCMQQEVTPRIPGHSRASTWCQSLTSQSITKLWLVFGKSTEVWVGLALLTFSWTPIQLLNAQSHQAVGSWPMVYQFQFWKASSKWSDMVQPGNIYEKKYPTIKYGPNYSIKVHFTV